MPSVSLVLNIVVSGVTIFNYTKARYLSNFSFLFRLSISLTFTANQFVLLEYILALVFVIALFAASASLLNLVSVIKINTIK
jgi:hypothetical protein